MPSSVWGEESTKRTNWIKHTREHCNRMRASGSNFSFWWLFNKTNPNKGWNKEKFITEMRNSFSHYFLFQVPNEGNKSLYIPHVNNSEEWASCSVYTDPSNHSVGTQDCTEGYEFHFYGENEWTVTAEVLKQNLSFFPSHWIRQAMTWRFWGIFLSVGSCVWQGFSCPLDDNYLLLRGDARRCHLWWSLR